MNRIYSDYVYSEAPRARCWWTETCDLPALPVVQEDMDCDVAIIGGGVTGLNAALTLAAAGTDTVLLEGKVIGWGASGRNGGFCCLGGARGDSNARIDTTFGPEARHAWRQAEKDAVTYVSDLIETAGMEVDRHSDGETWLAHRSKDMRDAEEKCAEIAQDYGVEAQIIEKADLAARGLQGGFHGAVQIPIGFALNPRKYLAGLTDLALGAGARLCEQAAVDSLTRCGGQWKLGLGARTVKARNVVVATNGYSSDTLPPLLSGRYMPMQSSVVTTRPLAADELAAQGWTSRQMSYDSRNLLHYFRLMPDNRMLFGMRGGLRGTAASEQRAQRRIFSGFRNMFPAWAGVEITHYWSGMVCMSRSGFPFVGESPHDPGLFLSLCYHGNGVAMGSYCGALIASTVLGRATDLPAPLSHAHAAFPLGRFRRLLTPFVYAGLKMADL